MNSVALTILELLAFNPQNYGSRDNGHAPFLNKKFMGHVCVVRENMYVKFEVRNFNRFGAIGI